jgi:hypothetical protein
MGDLLQGECSDLNGELLINLATALVALFSLLLCNALFERLPNAGSAVSWGRPYAIGAFLFSIVMWNTLPQVLVFILFHVASDGLFALQQSAACIMLAGLPILP